MSQPVISRIRKWLTPFVQAAHRRYLKRIWGMDIGKGAAISLSARLDRINPRGIHIGEQSTVTFEVAILTHDSVNRRNLDVHIGKWCFIGARSVILPGVTVGDHCIIGCASVVMQNVPPNSLVMGNPARVLEVNISTGPWGRRIRPVSTA